MGKDVKIHVVWWRHMATQILVNIGSGNGLLLDGNQAITWTTFDLSAQSSDIHLRQIPQAILQSPITKINLKVI